MTPTTAQGANFAPHVHLPSETPTPGEDDHRVRSSHPSTDADEINVLRQRLAAAETAYANALKDIDELTSTLRAHGLEMTSYRTATPVAV